MGLRFALGHRLVGGHPLLPLPGIAGLQFAVCSSATTTPISRIPSPTTWWACSSASTRPTTSPTACGCLSRPRSASTAISSTAHSTPKPDAGTANYVDGCVGVYGYPDFPAHGTTIGIAFLTQIDVGADWQFTRNWRLAPVIAWWPSPAWAWPTINSPSTCATRLTCSTPSITTASCCTERSWGRRIVSDRGQGSGVRD